MSANGTLASISNRSYAVIDAPLNLGKNTITATGSDQDCNIGSSFIKVNYTVPQGRRLLWGMDKIGVPPSIPYCQPFSDTSSE